MQSLCFYKTTCIYIPVDYIYHNPFKTRTNCSQAQNIKVQGRERQPKEQNDNWTIKQNYRRTERGNNIVYVSGADFGLGKNIAYFRCKKLGARSKNLREVLGGGG